VHKDALHTFGFSSEMVAIPSAFLLLVLAAMLLPAGQRKRARQGAVLLVLSLLCAGLDRVLPADFVMGPVLVFLSTFSLLASMGRSVVLLVLDVVVERRAARSTPRIFRDVSTAGVYLVVGLVALRSIDIEPASILTTSAVLTAVIGLGLQETLGNLVSGLALQMQRPFDVGDWVDIEEGQQSGRITEVTWRATTIMTLDDIEVTLPNGRLAKASIRNYSRPSKISRRRVSVGVTYAAPPQDVHDALLAAVRDVPGVLMDPQPFARTRGFGDSAIDYDLLFYVDDFGQAATVDGAVRDRIYYVLRRRGLEIPYPTRQLLGPPAVDPTGEVAAARERCASAIAAVDLFRALPKDALDRLGAKAQVRLYGAGEIIWHKGDPGAEIYVIESGTVALEVSREGAPDVEALRLGAGTCFGEAGFLTGGRASNIRATSASRFVVVDHDALHDVLGSHPEVVEGMGAMLASRQAAVDAVASAQPPEATTEEQSRRFIGQIRHFFKLT
jgi:small-conductance mechanosensitive channel/CRP-like cAMP-binding protein